MNLLYHRELINIRNEHLDYGHWGNPKKVYVHLKFRDYHKMTKTVFLTYSRSPKQSTLDPMFINNIDINVPIPHLLSLKRSLYDFHSSS